ncbi:hypothetical protein KIN20_004347 [Parelaphostrongylus tenuis]|uniref:Uncharacterized protein n=1 Tax=Parelaphostrongylus tenuis TaxID=148309 RepID=A0AAD5QGU0_PARTN|nr:hypothetical protein KIN20_004347 [Parelaphostrongylus tenuis]
MGFVQRLVMQTVFDVLENQGRSALLPDDVISNILSQLTVTVTYAPMMCTKVHLGLPDRVTRLTMMDRGCIIVGNTVTGVCTVTVQRAMLCRQGGRNVKIMPVSGPPLTISGSPLDHK